jgi:hypothetical protein
MAQTLCPHCLSFNKPSAYRCLNCNQVLRTSWWANANAGRPLSVSPFSATLHTVETPLDTLRSSLGSFSWQPRYHLYLLAFAALGVLAIYVRHQLAKSEEPPMQRMIRTHSGWTHSEWPVPAPGHPIPPFSVSPSISLSPPTRVSPPPHVPLGNVVDHVGPSRPTTFPGGTNSWTGTVPRSSRARLQSTSQTQFRFMPPPVVRTQIMAAYTDWKSQHAKSVAEVDDYMSHYASDAVIFNGERYSRAWLRDMAVSVRQKGTYRIVSDLNSLQWSADDKTNPRRVQLVSSHRYGNIDGTAFSGTRRLIWEKVGHDWKIIEDHFPNS